MTTPDKPGEFPLKPIRTVAVVGAGISGISAAAHLMRAGLSVTVFERSAASGGVWSYDARPPLNPPYPNERPSAGDYTPSAPGQHHSHTQDTGTAELSHAPPSAAYAGLRTNIPTSLMATSLAAYPADTPEIASCATVLEYIRQVSRETGVEALVLHRTRVEAATKNPDGGQWSLRTLTLTLDGDGGGDTARWAERQWTFDAVVAASGHYLAARVPRIPGLAEWKARFPARVAHAKQYRSPEPFRGRNVLLVGAGVSAGDIARELDGVAARTYQSARGGRFDTAPALLPPHAERVVGVKRFIVHEQAVAGSGVAGLADESHVPGGVELLDGRILDDMDSVVLATGYMTAYPYLAQLHSDTAGLDGAGEELVVTGDGAMSHNLYRDIFYVPDPTLAFLAVPFHLSVIPTLDFQAQVVARVFSGQAGLPAREKMRAEHQARVRERGLGRHFHSYLGEGAELRYVAGLVDWVNRDARARGVPLMDGHSDAFVANYRQLRERAMARGVFADPSVWETG
ncbi:hypothetical protein B0T26DRAFT_757890 [Lasiosphaeria miniovina]|uniref:Thiol-specific monooxygenase n=1 Tax=Lasiosphaeria miniovina TaxID=1954250 RepID=A0AA39ZQX8_9PEZI|nr:uncharacterized protein B0T26DRAFT_757890 [Lasiosphaeria miniovina]KAK0701919.1 hypothetical protein B0T26DRAFT_757890 [Lasiosphaeria miniovina]